MGIEERLVVAMGVVYHTSCVTQHPSRKHIAANPIIVNDNSDNASSSAPEEAEATPGLVDIVLKDRALPVTLRYTRV